MANITFNIAKGRVNELVRRVDANDPAGAVLVIVPIETAGLESDATLIDKDDLAAVLSGATNEQTTMGRKTLTDTDFSAPTPDDPNDRFETSLPQVIWTAPAGNALSKLLVCYGEGGADSTIVPLTLHDCTLTPDGVDFALLASVFFRAS